MLFPEAMEERPNPSTSGKVSNHLARIFSELTYAFVPKERLTVAAAAEKYRYLNNPGSYTGPWLNSETPYMVKPMEALKSRLYNGVAFCGPAQCGKTEALILNWIAYLAVVEGADMLLFNPTMAIAKDFSERRLDRMARVSKDVGAEVVAQKSATSMFSKRFKNGTFIGLSWPSISHFAGRPVPYVALTDFDRMDDDVGGEGSPFDLGNKRTTTFGSFGKTLAESSPSRPVLNSNWLRSTPHEAPPVGGIMGIYNRGNRQRYYWPCPDCGEFFEGEFKHLVWDNEPGMNPTEASETVKLVCPACGVLIPFDERQNLYKRAQWLEDGQAFDNGRIVGSGPRTPIASFWLNGIAARYTTWQRLVYVKLEAEKDFAATNNEESLKKFYNTDLGVPYQPKSVQAQRDPLVMKSRAEMLAEQEVPEGVRFLVATIDVQANKWVVHVSGVLPGSPFDLVLIDRFDIQFSKRLNEAEERLWVKPATYLEDWDLIAEQVLSKTYQLSDGSKRTMGIRMAACDSGGRDGVTTMAYNFVRRLRTEEDMTHLASRFHLLKGEPSPKAPRTRIGFPDSSKKDKLSGARGDVPVLFLNSNQIKDSLAGRFDSLTPGKGMYRLPNWLPDAVFSELCAETRNEKGEWVKVGRGRNEAWDLSYYTVGLCVSSLIGAERIPWDNAPGWAREWDKNDLVAAEGQERFGANRRQRYSMKDIAKRLA